MAQTFKTAISIVSGAASSQAIAAKVDGDTNNRINVDGGGKITWGDGSSAGDTNLYRSAANTLTSDDAFTAVSLGVNGEFTFPTVDGTADQILTTDGLGTVSWVDNAAASVTVSDAAPSSASEGDFWFESDTGDIYVYYDGNWVDIGGSSVANIATTDTPPSSPTNGDFWFETDTGKTFVYYNDGTSSQWVEVGAASSSATGLAGYIQFANGNGAFDSDSALVWDSANSELEVTGTVITDALTVNQDAEVDGILTANHIHGNIAGSVYLHVKNTSGSSIPAGTPVYATGSVGASGATEVSPSDASTAATMPALGITQSTLAINAEGHATVLGVLGSQNTGSYAVNDSLYVAPGGGLTTTRPTASTDLVQKIARVIRSDASTGEFLVLGAGRTNDIPNDVTLGTDTLGDYVESLVAGTGVTLSNNSGEGATPTIEIGQSVGTTDNVTFATVTADLTGAVTGNASTASALQTARTISLGGDLSGSASFDGSSDITISATIGLDSVALGTDTTGNYVDSLVAGTGVTLANNTGEGATPTVSIGQDVSTTANVTFATVTADLTGTVTGNASTASSWATARTITLGGDLSGSVSIDGSADVTLTATVAADSVALGTDTTGDYVQSLVAGTGITLSNNSGEGATPTIEIGQAVGTSDNVTFNNVTVSGDLTVSGSTTTIDTSTLTVDDPLIILASNNNATDAVDIGFYGLYDTSGSQDLYAGLFRDASDGKFRLFVDSQTAPTTTVDTTATGYTVGSLVANIEGDVTGNADTATVWANSRTITLGGDLSGSVSLDGSSDVTLTATIGADSVALGTDTTGDYVQNLVAGTGVTLSNNSGEGSTPTVEIGQSVGTTDNVTFNTVTADLSGNATTASAWATARTITLGGDLSGSVSIDGSADVTLTATVAADSVALGTDTTGNYMEDISAGTGVTITHTPAEGSTGTIAIGQAVATTDDVTFNTVTGTNGVITLTTSGTPTSTISDGAIAVDTSNNILYFRSGSTWQQVSGGVEIGDAPPSSPNDGDLWWESDTGRLKVYYNDGTTSQWVDAFTAGAGTTGSGSLLWTQFYYDSGSTPTGSVTGTLGENHGTWYEATASNYANTGLGSNNAADDPTLTGITYSSATGRFTGFPQGVYQISFTGNAAIDAAGLTISTQKYVYLQGSGIYADFPINILPEAAYHNYPNFETGFSVVTTAVMSNATASNNYLEVATSTQSSNFYGYYGYLSITKIG